MSVNQQVSSGQICLYLWRSLEAPGVSYLPSSAESAHNVYCEMRAEGYIVKAVELGSGREFEVRNGALVPVRFGRPSNPDLHGDRVIPN